MCRVFGVQLGGLKPVKVGHPPQGGNGCATTMLVVAGVGTDTERWMLPLLRWTGPCPGAVTEI